MLDSHQKYIQESVILSMNNISVPLQNKPMASNLIPQGRACAELFSGNFQRLNNTYLLYMFKNITTLKEKMCFDNILQYK